ncbi:MAG TPA: efflux RND transporter permease subunit, partial [Planctomycetaceae bacterium]|nr:efflux RND transporter permease subunit [Planctomycetaceae bacterium]
MKRAISWAVRNTPAMNTLMLGILIVGLLSMLSLRREVFPQFELEIILVTVPYPGATPEEVERGICQKIEEAVHAIDGITKQLSVAREGTGFVVLELDPRTDPQKALNEIRSEVDAIPSFPELAEEPEIQQITFRIPAIKVGVMALETDDPDAEMKLRKTAEQIRDELIHLPAVSQARIMGARDFQIDVEISEETLRKYNLTLQRVADILRRQNVELPGGSIKTPTEEILLRAKNKGLTGEEIARLPLLETPGGDVLKVGDLATVRDGFVDDPVISMINGRPGLVIAVERTRAEDLLALTRDVRDYLRKKRLPGYELAYWADQSVDVADRIDMLVRNGIQGLMLVFFVLAVFLDLRLAFWVALGIPISVFG